ncbi:hypothetical protein DM860_009033 [Cuscuta australis]|uniref:AAA+ ATPase domain-containing protein n=1 Tax=Cuscuta australis TaxID=267555 RepID=A0A328DC35_9ASTE|nr:hypothetical protein DM860_009033 [Cuscuta australis]
MMMEVLMSKLGASFATLVFFWTLCQNFFPPHLRTYLISRCNKISSFFNPFVHITFHEFEPRELFDRSKVFLTIERYLGHISSGSANRFIAKPAKDSFREVVLSMGNYEEVVDVYNGVVKVWWSSAQITSVRQSMSLFPREDDKRFFNLKFHMKDQEIVTKSYLQHVLAEGEAIQMRERKLKLYTNNKSDEWSGWKSGAKWSHVIFKHPSTFDTLAMEPTRKQEIVDELLHFKESKEYYAKIGKAWKRGYLLHGPPGTGKSSMIAAMATLMQYDIYDLELTAVKDNNELRRLLIDTSGKSIIVIEDIDCSLNLTGQREKKEDEKEEKDPIKKELLDMDLMKKKKESEVTLSGLLNVIDGLWSAIGEERLIIFTTNHIEKLDPALIRRGRMDNHIEMSYCCFEAFKVLAKNYLGIGNDSESSHPLFPEIRRLLGETKTTPADVAENVMPKSAREKADTCLERLVKALETAKEEARLKAEEEKRANAVKEEEAHRKKKKQEADDVKKEETSPVQENGDARE